MDMLTALVFWIFAQFGHPGPVDVQHQICQAQSTRSGEVVPADDCAETQVPKSQEVNLSATTISNGF